MLAPKLQMLERTVKRLMRRGASGALERVIVKTHAADLAFLLPGLSPGECQGLIERCPDDEKRAAIIAEAVGDNVELAARILTGMPRERAVELLHEIEPDDVSDLLEAMPPDVAEEILERMEETTRHEVEELASYESTTAGGIMSPRFFALSRETTARQAIEALQEPDTELEMVFYVYVVGDEGRLDGVLSLRQLVTTKPETLIGELMTTDVISVGAQVDQEEVAKLASRYGLLAIPVVDPNFKLVGIVTVDDVIDVLREEAAEDILRMAGAGGGEAHQQNVLLSVLSRFPWLLATGIGGAISAALVGMYATALSENLPLLAFIPLVLGLAGVTGLQSATIMAHNIAEGRPRPLLSTLRQTAIGALLGLTYGAIVAGFGYYWWGNGTPGGSPAWLVVGCGVAVAMIAASILGSLLPLLFARLRLDPALAAGPFVAIAVDLAGLLLYLSIGARLLA